MRETQEHKEGGWGGMTYILIVPSAVDFPIANKSKVKYEGLHQGKLCFATLFLGLVIQQLNI